MKIENGFNPKAKLTNGKLVIVHSKNIKFVAKESPYPNKATYPNKVLYPSKD